ncbi:MAG: substrate-binding domain-containing protein [Alkalispirochaeta sp.]
MRGLKALVPVILVAILAACQTYSVSDYRFDGETTIVSTTFNDLPPEIRGLKPDMIADDGTLHLEARRREPVVLQVDGTMTRTTRISFRIKLGDLVDEDYPMFSLYMLRRGNPEAYAAIRLDDRFGVRYLWRTENSRNNEELTTRRFSEGKWVAVDIVLNDDELLFFMNGVQLGRGFVPSYLPDAGAFRMESYNEAWIDDLRVVTFSGAGDPAVTRRNATPVDVAIVMPDAPQWRDDGETITEEIAATGYAAEARYSAGDQALQNEQIRNLVDRGARVLIVGAVDGGVDSALAEAAQEGVTVVAYNRFVPDSDDIEYYLTFDTTVVGEMQGTMIAEALELQRVFANDPKYIALLAGDPEAPETAIHFDAAIEILAPHIDRGALRVIGPGPKSSDSFQFNRITVPGGTADAGEFQMRNLLVTDADDVTLDAVLVPGDAIAEGVITALRDDPRYTDPGSFPVVTGAGGSPEALQRVAEGYQYMTVVQDTDELARFAASLASSLLDGFESPEMEGVRVDNELHRSGDNVITTYFVNPSLVVTEEKR